MIKICDSIMGSGKTTAAIRYMNEHPEKRYIYITPYRSEADRIQSGCKDLNFKRPKYQVIAYSTELIQAGENIATTHQAFKLYTPEIKKYIKENGYTLIVDESIELLEELSLSAGDLRMCERAGYIKIENNNIQIVDDSYDGGYGDLKEFFKTIRCRDLMMFADGSNTLYYWLLPLDLITAFEDVIVMTYMFDGQELSYLFEMGGIKYQYIGLNEDENGTYFADDAVGNYQPEYVQQIASKIHILDNKKLNSIGEDDFALSKHWFEREGNDDQIEALKRHLHNYFQNIIGTKSSECMWSSYLCAKNSVRGKGYTNGFVSFNARAENKYASKNTLAYAVNVFMNVGRKIYFKQNGIEVDDDAYALSTMVQWIWRSAIRNGEDINLYIPSKRMRNLLLGWMSSLTGGDNYVKT